MNFENADSIDNIDIQDVTIMSAKNEVNDNRTEMIG